MWLPTQAQVNAATRHVASFVGGAILMFGLSSKLDPNTVQQVITQTGTLLNDLIALIGIVTPIVAGYYASRSANPVVQTQAAAAVAATPGPLQAATAKALLNAAADAVPGTERVVNPNFAPDPATSPKVTTT